MINNIDIMAPVGSYESLHAAIQASAGSVYFGVGRLNMRAKSSTNFSLEDLKNIADICSANNVKTYLTANTVMYDDDLAEMREILDTAKQANINAVIASDISVLEYANQIGLEAHISTQVNVSNLEAVRFYSRFADVIVLARELNLKQVKSICTSIKKEHITGPTGNLIQIEIFIHGALCMAISGKCYMSLHENNRSANRGACLQNCRRSYTVRESDSDWEMEIDNEYIMSPKDLCTIGFLDKIIDAGATVLKIEGRGRAADYVKKTVEVYSSAVKAYYEGNFTEENIAQWKTQLATVFNRGFWDGYYLGQRLGEWNDRYGSQATKTKIQIGKVTNYFSKVGAAEIAIQSGELRLGDEIMFTGPTTGVVQMPVTEIRYNEECVETAEKGWTISMPVTEKLRRSDKLYKIVDSEFAD
ncbi:MAG: peptidase U32 family protein [bacterium]